jgi:hypothetical protein
MARAGLLTVISVAALASCAQAFALGATATTSVQIVPPSAGIQVVSPLVLPTVTATTINSGSSLVGATTVGTTNVGATTSGSGSTGGGGSATGATPGSNATLTIHGEAGDAVSMAVPESFQVIRSGGTEALTVKTNTNAEYGLAGDGVVLGGAVMGSSSMSVNVGGAISLASAAQVTPGAYEGLLVVVVQYN